VSKKSISDIFDCNLKTSYQILIIFGMNIPDITCHQFPIPPSVCFCTTHGKQIKRNMCWKKQKTCKNIPDIIDRYLKKD